MIDFLARWVGSMLAVTVIVLAIGVLVLIAGFVGKMLGPLGVAAFLFLLLTFLMALVTKK